MQEQLMMYDPATGMQKPYPSHAEQWRKFHGEMAWLFNPWTGTRRHALDVGSDTFGRGIRIEDCLERAAVMSQAQGSSQQIRGGILRDA